MNDAVDSVRHNVWATRRLLEFCRELPEEKLVESVGGESWTLVQTLGHFIRAERGYRYFLGDSYPEWEWNPDESPSIDVLIEHADDNESFWEKFLAEPFDPDRTMSGQRGSVRAEVVLAQVINHGNNHRNQACSIITTLGLEPPRLDAWAYGRAVGRMTAQSAQTESATNTTS